MWSRKFHQRRENWKTFTGPSRSTSRSDPVANRIWGSRRCLTSCPRQYNQICSRKSTKEVKHRHLYHGAFYLVVVAELSNKFTIVLHKQSLKIWHFMNATAYHFGPIHVVKFFYILQFSLSIRIKRLQIDQACLPLCIVFVVWPTIVQETIALVERVHSIFWIALIYIAETLWRYDLNGIFNEPLPP